MENFQVGDKVIINMRNGDSYSGYIKDIQKKILKLIVQYDNLPCTLTTPICEIKSMERMM